MFHKGRSMLRPFCLTSRSPPAHNSGMSSEQNQELRVEIKGLMLDPASNIPIVILRDTQSQLFLPIWIGVFEANAIALRIEGVEPPRPMTHDLLKQVVEQLGALVEKIVRHRTRRLDAFDPQGDRVSLEDADPDRQEELTLGVAKDDDGNVGRGVQHQTADLDSKFLTGVAHGPIVRSGTRQVKPRGSSRKALAVQAVGER